jgi:hypothetical protein
MKTFLKYSMTAGAIMILAGSVYAIPTLVVTDGSGISSISTSASGVVTITTSDSQWSVVVATGVSSPPSLGQGTAAAPVMDLSISATYIGNGTTGNPLTISFGADGFGPTLGNVIATLTGQLVKGTGNPVAFATLVASGTVLPTTGSPIISGSVLTAASIPNSSGTYTSKLIGGPINLSSYSLDEVVELTGSAGGSQYSIDASLETTVPDGGMTLVLLGSALSGLALIKKKLV